MVVATELREHRASDCFCKPAGQESNSFLGVCSAASKLQAWKPGRRLLGKKSSSLYPSLLASGLALVFTYERNHLPYIHTRSSPLLFKRLISPLLQCCISVLSSRSRLCSSTSPSYLNLTPPKYPLDTHTQVNVTGQDCNHQDALNHSVTHCTPHDFPDSYDCFLVQFAPCRCKDPYFALEERKRKGKRAESCFGEKQRRETDMED